ncbi:hypothetical protein K443DRAFT_685588, partial [Laccaria amethystina LaAM-08-1]
MISHTTVVRLHLRRGRAPSSCEVSSLILSSSVFYGACKSASSTWWMPGLLEDIAIGSTAPAATSAKSLAWGPLLLSETYGHST